MPFNDVDALERELANGDVAVALFEPALTNVGIVLPEPGYHDAVRELTRRHGTLLIIDETHTICAGPGGYTAAHGLQPDLVTIGKTIGGGVPAGAYGFSADVAERIRTHMTWDDADVGGIGGTLAGNALSMAAIAATLTHVLTDEAFARMIPLAERWAAGVDEVIRARGVPWHVTRLGARAEYHFMPDPPRTGAEQWANGDSELERFLHLWAMNRGRPDDALPQHGADVARDERSGRRRAQHGVRRRGRRAVRLTAPPVGAPARMRVMGSSRSRAIALAVILDVIAVVAGVGLTLAMGQPIFLAFGLILAIAPWASVIDDAERRR